jgi:hypothetical protein
MTSTNIFTEVTNIVLLDDAAKGFLKSLAQVVTSILCDPSALRRYKLEHGDGHDMFMTQTST